jgi:hypothetical protein
MQKLGLGREAADARLAAVGGGLRKALAEK